MTVLFPQRPSISRLLRPYVLVYVAPQKLLFLALHPLGKAYFRGEPLTGIPQGQSQCLMMASSVPVSAVRLLCLKDHLGWALLFCYSPGASNSDSGVFARGSPAWCSHARIAGRQGQSQACFQLLFCPCGSSACAGSMCPWIRTGRSDVMGLQDRDASVT